MKSLHIKLDKNSPPIKWADAQADRIGARGHVGTHLDCYTTVPEKSEYNNHSNGSWLSEWNAQTG